MLCNGRKDARLIISSGGQRRGCTGGSFLFHQAVAGPRTTAHVRWVFRKMEKKSSRSERRSRESRHDRPLSIAEEMAGPCDKAARRVWRQDSRPAGSIRDVVDYGRIAAQGLEPYTSAECYLKSAAKMRYLARKSTVVNAATSVLSS